MRIAALIAALFWATNAAADLYRWVDPETGSVKFSSYPPPWYGDEKLEKRSPKVEHIPARGPGGSAPPETVTEGSLKPPAKPPAGLPARPAPPSPIPPAPDGRPGT